MGTRIVREDVPPVREVRARFRVAVDEMVEGARQFARAAREGGCTNADVFVCSDRQLELKMIPHYRTWPPSLILTSPPYPGVHVLYHRWQVLGRRETPAPFWIAGTLDGAGASYYTFGDRKNVPRYYELQGKPSLPSPVSDRKTVVAQMVAFSEPEWQLPSYLEVMQDSGFRNYLSPSWQIAETVASGGQYPIANGTPTKLVPPLAAKKLSFSTSSPKSLIPLQIKT